MKLIKFYKDDCPGCEELNNICNSNNLHFDEEINVTECKELRKSLKIMSAPTVILFDNNDNEIDRMTGINSIKLNILFEKRKESK